MRRLSFLFLLMFGVFSAGAESTAEKSFQATLYGGLYLNNEQAWQLEPSVTWYFHKYIGVSAGIELTRQYNQPGRMTQIDGHEAELADSDRNIGWIAFKPSVVFRSPSLWRSADDSYRLWVQAEPGISLACPFRNSLTYEIKEFEGRSATLSIADASPTAACIGSTGLRRPLSTLPLTAL